MAGAVLLGAASMASAAEFDLHRGIEREAERTGLPAVLIAAVIKAESGGRACVTSAAGAVGLMQLMPATARELGVDDRTDPVQNLRGGSDYLVELIEAAEGDVWRALGHYNYGTRAFTTRPHKWPDETVQYVGGQVWKWTQNGKDGAWKAYLPRQINASCD